MLWFEKEAKAGDVSLVDELTKLTGLKDMGLLKAEEFEQLKANLLGIVADEPVASDTAVMDSGTLVIAKVEEGALGKGFIEAADSILLPRKHTSKGKQRSTPKEKSMDSGRRRGSSKETHRQVILFEEPAPTPAPKPQLHPDEIVILPPALLRSLRTEQMVDRAVKRVTQTMRVASVDDVGDWLTSLGLGHRESTFREHGVWKIHHFQVEDAKSPINLHVHDTETWNRLQWGAFFTLESAVRYCHSRK